MSFMTEKLTRKLLHSVLFNTQQNKAVLNKAGQKKQNKTKKTKQTTTTKKQTFVFFVGGALF